MGTDTAECLAETSRLIIVAEGLLKADLDRQLQDNTPQPTAPGDEGRDPAPGTNIPDPDPTDEQKSQATTLSDDGPQDRTLPGSDLASASTGNSYTPAGESSASATSKENKSPSLPKN